MHHDSLENQLRYLQEQLQASQEPRQQASRLSPLLESDLHRLQEQLRLLRENEVYQAMVAEYEATRERLVDEAVDSLPTDISKFLAREQAFGAIGFTKKFLAWTTAFEEEIKQTIQHKKKEKENEKTVVTE